VLGKQRAVYEVERFRLSEIKKLLRPTAGIELSPIPDEGYFIPTSSGKAALCLALADLRMTGTIANKNDNVLVPRWLGYGVNRVMVPYAYPVLNPTERLKAILVYHQYGFPQDMEKIFRFAKDRDLTVIEDCSHAIGGHYKGNRIGSFGEYSIFSFSKFFPCVMGGGLWVKDQTAYERIQERINSVHSGFLQFLSILAKVRTEYLSRADSRIIACTYAMYDNHPKMNGLLRRLISNDIKSGAINKRRSNWMQLRELLLDSGLVDGLDEDVVPYVAPLKLPTRLLEKALASLADLGIHTGIYNFDVARNLLAPTYEKRLWVPIHQGLDKDDILQIGDLLLKLTGTSKA